MHRISVFFIASITLLGGIPVRAQTVDAGQSHSVVATSDGRVFTWGYNTSGQLGDGTTTQRTIPTEVPALTDAVADSGGLNHTFALKNDGSVRALGSNSDWPIADGTTTRTTPTRVLGLGNVVKITAVVPLPRGPSGRDGLERLAHHRRGWGRVVVLA